MSEPIISRAKLAADAECAAQRAVEHGVEQPNPHPIGSDANAAWHAAYCRFLVLYSASEAEGSA